MDVKTKKLKIAGVINSYRFDKSIVFDHAGIATNYYVKENTGIINACSIQKVLDIITANFSDN